MVRRNPTIVITRHARERAAERWGKKLSAPKLGRYLLDALCIGARPNRSGAIEVHLGDGIVGVFKPEFGGYWSVVTVMDRLGGSEWTA